MDKQLTERTPHNFFRCRSEDCIIAKCLKPTKDNDKQQKQLYFNKSGNCSYYKESENSDNDNDLKMYAFMTRMAGNGKIPSVDSGDSSQLTSWIVDSESTCHMTPQVSDFIPGSLEDMDKYIEVTGGHHVTAKQNVKVQIKMGNYKRDNFIATFQNILLAPDI